MKFGTLLCRGLGVAAGAGAAVRAVGRVGRVAVVWAAAAGPAPPRPRPAPPPRARQRAGGAAPRTLPHASRRYAPLPTPPSLTEEHNRSLCSTSIKFTKTNDPLHFTYNYVGMP